MMIILANRREYKNKISIYSFNIIWGQINNSKAGFLNIILKKTIIVLNGFENYINWIGLNVS
jgi:hypothetical protein